MNQKRVGGTYFVDLVTGCLFLLLSALGSYINNVVTKREGGNHSYELS